MKKQDGMSIVDQALIENVHFLSDEAFPHYMATTCQEWLNKTVHSDFLINKEGMKLRYYYSLQNHPAKSIVIMHGFCGFFGKYHEIAMYFYQSGYNIFFIEQRGHGESEREIINNELVYVKSFDDYVMDLKAFMDKVVIPIGQTQCCDVFAHSMGGGVTTLFLERYPHYFHKAILSAPMIKMKTGLPKVAILGIEAYAKLFHKEKEKAVAQSAFSFVPAFDQSSCMSKVRYDYQYKQRQKYESYRTNASTYGWAMAALDASKVMLKNASKIEIPVLLFQAGQDGMVENYAQDILIHKNKHIQLVRFNDSRHEIFNATDEIRRKYYSWIFQFLKG